MTSESAIVSAGSFMKLFACFFRKPFRFKNGDMRCSLKDVTLHIKPRNIEELTAFYAMYRPGSMTNLPAYVEGKNNPSGITYMEPSFKDILAPTYGILVYSEQLVQLVHDYCGCSMEEANKIRLRLQKKKDVQLCCDEFIQMSIRQGHGVEETQKVFEYLLQNSSYTIAKCHVISFVILAYREAYIKCHFPDVFNKYFYGNDAV